MGTSHRDDFSAAAKAGITHPLMELNRRGQCSTAVGQIRDIVSQTYFRQIRSLPHAPRQLNRQPINLPAPEDPDIEAVRRL